MSEHQKQTIIRWFEEVWNKGRRQAIDEMLPLDCVIHDGGTSLKGPEEFKKYFDLMRSTFSEIQMTPEEVISEGALVCLRWSVKMRHTGDGLGMPATGRNLQTTGISIVRFTGGRFAEAWQSWDMLGIMQQIQQAEPAKLYMRAR
jgi:predicted ester cyclase